MDERREGSSVDGFMDQIVRTWHPNPDKEVVGDVSPGRDENLLPEYSDYYPHSDDIGKATAIKRKYYTSKYKYNILEGDSCWWRHLQYFPPGFTHRSARLSVSSPWLFGRAPNRGSQLFCLVLRQNESPPPWVFWRFLQPWAPVPVPRWEAFCLRYVV